MVGFFLGGLFINGFKLSLGFIFWLDNVVVNGGFVGLNENIIFVIVYFNFVIDYLNIKFIEGIFFVIIIFMDGKVVVIFNVVFVNVVELIVGMYLYMVIIVFGKVVNGNFVKK